jgi:hypothetical protein
VSLPSLSSLLRRLRSNARRSLGQREVAVHGLCLLLLVALFVFAASSPISVAMVLGMLCALGHEQRRSGPRARNGLARWLEEEGAEDEGARERPLWTHRKHTSEEEPWKSDS